MKIVIERTSEHARIPTQGSPGAAGYDLYAAETVTLESTTPTLVATDIKIRIPLGYYGQIAPRSGLALKQGIDVMGGVIDSDYRGKVGVILILHSSSGKTFTVNKGDRIAQLIILPCISNVLFVEGVVGEDTERGGGGFGSTGVNL